MKATKAILLAIYRIFASRRFSEEQDMADLEFDRAIARAKMFNREKEKLENIKILLSEVEKKHPENLDQIQNLKEAISEKEKWMAKSVYRKLDKTNEL